MNFAAAGGVNSTVDKLQLLATEPTIATPIFWDTNCGKDLQVESEEKHEHDNQPAKLQMEEAPSAS